MELSIQKHGNGKLGIWLGEEWLMTHFDPIPLESDDKALLDGLLKKMQELRDILELSNGRIVSPQIPVYHILSFHTQVNNGFDLITEDYEWIISCDPIFHPVTGEEQSAQLSYFDPALEWLDLIGARYKILPQRFQSKEEITEENQLHNYLIDDESAKIIYNHWTCLNSLERAVFYYIYLNAEHNFIASFLAIKEMIDAEVFAKMVTASISIAPEFSGVTEKTFREGWTHYARIIENVLSVRKGVIRK